MKILRLVPALLFPILLASGWAVPAIGEEDSPDDLSIGKAVEMALENHPALREAEAKARQARGTVQDIRSGREWQLKAEARQVHLSEVPTLGPFPAILRMPAIRMGEEDQRAGVVTLQKVIHSGGRIEAAVSQASNGASAACSGIARTRQVVCFEAERSFLQLVLAQREVEVARKALETAEEYLRVAKSRLEARSTAQFDVLRAEVQVEESRQDLIKADASVRTARAALGQTLAVPPRDWVATENGLLASFSLSDLPDLDDSITLALKTRPEITGARFQVRAAKAGLNAARRERNPTVNLLADYQRYDPKTATQLNRWSAVVVAGVPILDGGHAAARVRSAKAGVEQQEAGTANLQNQVEREVRQAHARIQSASNQVKVADKRLELAEEMLRIAHVRYSSGMSTVTEVADAQTSVTRARQGQIRALSDLRMAEAEFRLAKGMDWAGRGLDTSSRSEENKP